MPSKSTEPRPVERRSHVRRASDGDRDAAQKFSDHGLALAILGIIGRVVVGVFILGGLWIVKDTLVPFAGKTTNVTASITISVAVALTVGGGWLIREQKFRERGKELQRLRGELEEYRANDSRLKAVNQRRRNR